MTPDQRSPTIMASVAAKMLAPLFLDLRFMHTS
jgi:hypothetical protein